MSTYRELPKEFSDIESCNESEKGKNLDSENDSNDEESDSEIEEITKFRINFKRTKKKIPKEKAVRKIKEKHISPKTHNDNSIIQIKVLTGVVQNIFETFDQILKEYKTYHIEEIQKCLNGEILTIYSFGWVYGKDFDKIDIKEFSKLRKDKMLFINQFPHLIAEISPNNTVKYDKLKCFSPKHLLWSCLKCEDHKDYLGRINNKTDPNKLNQCKQCLADSLRTTPKSVKEEHLANHTKKVNTGKIINYTQIGDDTEIYVMNLLKEHGKFLNVERTGQTGEKADIKITLQSGDKKAIQVKTLTEKKDCKKSFSVNSTVEYQNDMLMVMVSNDRKSFALIFYEQTKDMTTFGPGSYEYRNNPSLEPINPEYKNMLFNDVKKFTKKLIELIPKSSDYQLILSESSTKEYGMFERLEKFCNSNGLSFRRNETNGDTIDCYVNDMEVQCKYMPLNHGVALTYKISVHKASGKKDGKSYRRPYSVDDPIKFIFVEIGGCRTDKIEDQTKYHSNFCIIPKSLLIKQKVLQSSTCEGKPEMLICPPDYLKNHWSKSYWNNIDLLKKSYFQF